jgi:hypothetical protein
MVLFVFGVFLAVTFRPYLDRTSTISGARVDNSAKASSCDTNGKLRTRSVFEPSEPVVDLVSHVGVCQFLV